MTGKKSICARLKGRSLLLISLPILVFRAHTQSLVGEIPLPEPPLSVYVDRPGDLYLRFSTSIVHIDTDGKKVGEYRFGEQPIHFEPRDGSRMFIHLPHKNTWGFTAFGRSPTAPVPPEFAIKPSRLCASGDHGYWIVDAADVSLRRINLKKGTSDLEFTLPERFKNDTIICLREYFGFLFIATRLHLLMFSATGRLLKEWPLSVPDFDFLGEEIYIRQNNEILFVDLFDGSQYRIPAEPGTLFQRFTDERHYLVYPDRVVIRKAD